MRRPYKFKVKPDLLDGVFGLVPTFPMLMLQYDCCWPASERDVLELNASIKARGKAKPITLLSYDKPTTARWRSFNWLVVEEGRA